MFGNNSSFPFTDAFLKRFTQRGYHQDLLKAMATRSRSFETFDFNVKALDTTNQWTVGATSTATTWAVLAEAGGWIRGVTGASVATAGLQISIPQKYWTGSAGGGFASLIRLSAVTDIRLEQGFADVLPAVSTPMVSDLASVAFASTTVAAAYVYDNGTTSSTITGLYTVGASIAAARVLTTTNRYASGTTLFVAVELLGTTAKLWVGDEGRAPLAVATAALEAATGLIPFIAVKGQGATKNVDIDTIWTWTNGRV